MCSSQYSEFFPGMSWFILCHGLCLQLLCLHLGLRAGGPNRHLVSDILGELDELLLMLYQLGAGSFVFGITKRLLKTTSRVISFVH